MDYEEIKKLLKKYGVNEIIYSFQVDSFKDKYLEYSKTLSSEEALQLAVKEIWKDFTPLDGIKKDDKGNIAIVKKSSFQLSLSQAIINEIK